MKQVILLVICLILAATACMAQAATGHNTSNGTTYINVSTDNGQVKTVVTAYNEQGSKAIVKGIKSNVFNAIKTKATSSLNYLEDNTEWKVLVQYESGIYTVTFNDYPHDMDTTMTRVNDVRDHVYLTLIAY